MWSICNRYAISGRMDGRYAKEIHHLRSNIPRKEAIEYMPARSSTLVLAGLLALISMFPISLGARPAEPPQYPFQNIQLPPEQRIDDLISRLTPDEKIHCALAPTPRCQGSAWSAQITWKAYTGSRWVVPVAGKGRERPSFRPDNFPQARGLGQTWDPDLIQQAAAVEGHETRYAWQSPSTIAAV